MKSLIGQKVIGLLVFVSMLLAACGQDAPTATSGPPTATLVAVAPTNTPLPPTPTPVPPTATETPTPTSTDVPPEPTSTPLPPEPTLPPVPLLSLEKSPQDFGNTGTFQVGLGDLDGDGDLDAVFANTQSNNSQVWLNDGGQFVDSGQELTQYGHGVGLGDWDGDGDLDLFIACHFFVTPSKIYLNDGQGTFHATGQDLGDAGISGADLDVVDVNGDGKLDVHVMYYDPQGLPDKVYLSDGTGTFIDSGLALDEETIAWGDLDGDGDVDYFGKRWGQGYVVQLNDGSGRFTEGWQMEDSQSTVGGVALADLDGDGDLDALVANGFRSTGSFPSLLLWNNGGGQFIDSGQRLNETLGAELAVGDLDGDGDLDVFVASLGRPNEVWLNDGGQLIDSGLRLGANSDMTGNASLGDVDGDGDLDVFVGCLGGRAELWLNGGAVEASVGKQGNAGEPSSAPSPATVAAEIGAYVEDLASQGQFSGAVLVAHDDEPLFKGAYGSANRASNTPNQIDTKFNLGSMDKMFTAVAIMQLVEEGKLSLDDKVLDVLPDYPNEQVAKAVTIHQLLTHTSGLGDWSESPLFPALHGQIRGVADYLPLFVDTPLEFEPGEQFRYSNSGYIVLGLIIERITGQSYYDYVRVNIFEPSGMENTAAYELDADMPNLAVGYTQVAIDGSGLDEITDYGFAAPMKGGPSGGGFSTVEDLFAFRNALLDHRLLGPESTEVLLEGKVRLNDQAQYAYGFFARILEGQRLVGHSGGAPGICDTMDIYLDQDYTFIVLSNSDNDCVAAFQFAREVLLR